MMSLHTLLKAAEFLELSSERIPRENATTRATGQHGAGFQMDRRRVVSESDALDRRRRPGGAGTRETHNKLEKNRRAHLKECFDVLKSEVPTLDEKKTSNLNILRSALKHIQVLKKQERDYETEYDLLKISQRTMRERVDALKTNLVADKKLPPHLDDLPEFKQIGETKPFSTSTITASTLAFDQSFPVSVATQTPPSPSNTEDTKLSVSAAEVSGDGGKTSSSDSGLEGSSSSDTDGKVQTEELHNSVDDDYDDEKTDTDEGLSPSDDEKDFEIDVVGSDDVKVEILEKKDANKRDTKNKQPLRETITKGWSTTPYCNSRSRKRTRSEETKNEEDSDYDADTKESPKTKIQACARVSS